MPRLVVLVALTVSFTTACAGWGNDYSDREKEAIDRAEHHLRTTLDTEALGVGGVSAPSSDGDLWRVELDTDKGYRCVYMYSEPGSRLELLSVKSGAGCGGKMLYNRAASNSLGPERPSLRTP